MAALASSERTNWSGCHRHCPGTGRQVEGVTNPGYARALATTTRARAAYLLPCRLRSSTMPWPSEQAMSKKPRVHGVSGDGLDTPCGRFGPRKSHTVEDAVVYLRPSERRRAAHGPERTMSGLRSARIGRRRAALAFRDVVWQLASRQGTAPCGSGRGCGGGRGGSDGQCVCEAASTRPTPGYLDEPRKTNMF